MKIKNIIFFLVCFTFFLKMIIQFNFKWARLKSENSKLLIGISSIIFFISLEILYLFSTFLYLCFYFKKSIFNFVVCYLRTIEHWFKYYTFSTIKLLNGFSSSRLSVRWSKFETTEFMVIYFRNDYAYIPEEWLSKF